MYLISNNYLVGRSVEPSEKKDSRREGGRGGGSGGWGKGRRTETERMGGKGGEVNGKRRMWRGGCPPKVFFANLDSKITNRKRCPPKVYEQFRCQKSQIARGVSLKFFRETRLQNHKSQGCPTKVFQQFRSQKSQIARGGGGGGGVG